MTDARPSRTAVKIARFMVLLDAVPRLRGLLPAGEAAIAESILTASEIVSPRGVEMLRSRTTQRFYAAAEALLGRGQLAWFGLRKRWFATQAQAAIADGCTQLLVLGAGLDPLATWIAERHPDVHCIEIDAPATAEPKRAALQRLGRVHDNLEVCAIDLAKTPLASALATTRWRSDARSVVVAEGLLMYLAKRDIERLFAALRECTGAASRVACSCMDAHDDGTPRVGVLDWPIRFALRLAGEPIQWGIQPKDVLPFATSIGCRVLAQPSEATLRREVLAALGLGDEPITRYEHLVLLERT
jgi:methyltransferase (TIGR00027 family)